MPITTPQGQVVDPGLTIKELIQQRNNNLRNMMFEYVDLSLADFSNCKLSGSQFHFCDLNWASFEDARMLNVCIINCACTYARFVGANCYGFYACGTQFRNAKFNKSKLKSAVFRDCCLRNIQLKGATIDWESHELISEILLQQADTTDRVKVATAVAAMTYCCWNDFVKLNDPELPWALDVLRKYVRGGRRTPKALR